MQLEVGTFGPLLQVFEMPMSLAFYRDVLGFSAVGDVPEDGQCDFVMLSLHEAELMLNTAYEADECPPQSDPARIAAHGDTALFFDCADVDAACAYLRAHGINVADPVVQDYGIKQLYLVVVWK